MQSVAQHTAWVQHISSLYTPSHTCRLRGSSQLSDLVLIYYCPWSVLSPPCHLQICPAQTCTALLAGMLLRCGCTNLVHATILTPQPMLPPCRTRTPHAQRHSRPGVQHLGFMGNSAVPRTGMGGRERLPVGWGRPACGGRGGVRCVQCGLPVPLCCTERKASVHILSGCRVGAIHGVQGVAVPAAEPRHGHVPGRGHVLALHLLLHHLVGAFVHYHHAADVALSLATLQTHVNKVKQSTVDRQTGAVRGSESGSEMTHGEVSACYVTSGRVLGKCHPRARAVRKESAVLRRLPRCMVGGQLEPVWLLTRFSSASILKGSCKGSSTVTKIRWGVKAVPLSTMQPLRLHTE